MEKHEQDCDAAGLRVLLHGDEDSDEYRKVACHIDTCHSCQRSLTRLAGQDEQWSEASELLSDFPDPASQQQLPSSSEAIRGVASGDTERPPKINFLAAPSHPEMLGRLGRYEIERVIGSGGMGIVLRGFDSELNRPVAIKVLAPHLCGRQWSGEKTVRA